MTAPDLLTAVQAACVDTPYVVTPTEKGFDVSLDIVNAKWHSLFNQYGLSEMFVHYVTVDETAKTYVIMDGSQRIERTDLGHGEYAFQVAGKAEKFWGTQISFEKEIAIGVKDDPSKPLSIGDPGVIYNYTFNSEEGRRLITGPAKALGYTKKMDWATKTGLICALSVPVGFVILGLAYLIWWLAR